MTEPSSADAPANKGRQGMLTGVAWMLGFRLFDRAAGILSILVLARLLLPEHFGVVALATGVVAFIELLASLGLDTILIQKKTLTDDLYDTAWTLQLCLATLCALLLCAAAVPAATFFREPRVQMVAFALSIGLLMDGLVNIRIVDFRRDMRFDKEFLFMATRRVVATSVTIVGAFLLRNEWALVIGILVSRTTGMVMSYVMRPARPRLTFAAKDELLGHSSWLFFSNILQFLRQRAAEFTLGRVSGTTSVGAYMLASDLANTLSQELVSPINRVALPDMAAQNTPQGIARRFDLLTGQLALVLTPMCFGLSACADLVVGLLFGPKWAATVDVLRILAVAGWVAGMGSNVGVGFMSLGLYRANAWIHAGGALILMPMLVGGALWDGARGAAVAVFCANLTTVVIAMQVSRRATDYGLLAFLRRIWRPVLASLLMAGAIQWVAAYLPTSLPVALRLLIEVACGALSYLALVLVLWLATHDDDSAEQLTWRLLQRLWGRFRPAGQAA